MTTDKMRYPGGMVTLVSEPSLTEHAYRQIRSDLLSGRVRPGARLKINELGEQLGVNISAIREALSRLGADGLVVALPQRGFRVASVSVTELRDLTQTRIEIEQLCIRKSVANPDIGWETGLVAAGHQLLRTSKAGAAEGPDERWKQAHAAFHRSTVAGCASAWLLRLHDQLYLQAERYLALSLIGPGSRRNVDAEHKAIMEALLARDGELACDRVAMHFERTTKLIVAAGLADAN